MNINNSFVWITVMLFLLVSLDCCMSPTNKKNINSSYEQKLIIIIEKEKNIIDHFNFQDDNISKKRLYDVIALGFSVHTWEIYSYKGAALERRKTADVIENIIINDLQINIDQSLLLDMKDEKLINQSMDLVPNVKDYFIRVLSSGSSRNVNLEMDLFMLTITRLFLALGFDGLLTGIEDQNEQSVKTGIIILKTNIEVVKDYMLSKNLMTSELTQQQMINILSTIETGSLNNSEKVIKLDQEVEAWFDNIIELDLYNAGYKKK